jgi:hypothetical protein
MNMLQNILAYSARKVKQYSALFGTNAAKIIQNAICGRFVRIGIE